MILRFILSHLARNIGRNAIVVLSVGFSSLFSLLLLFAYSNTVHTLEYYSIGETNPLRFEMSKSESFVSLFSKQKESGIDRETMQKIHDDPALQKWHAFSFVEVPIIAKIGIFDFSLETDIPVFSVSDSLLCKTDVCKTPTPMGVSRALLDFYNLNLAGSADIFPRMKEWYIQGQPIQLTIGSSTRFDFKQSNPAIVSGRVDSITNEFPGLGITIPESVARDALDQIGYELPSPFRVVGFLKSESDASAIRNNYSDYVIQFDSDKQASVRQKLGFLRTLFQVFTLANISILVAIIGFLIAGILKQYDPLFRTFRMIGASMGVTYLMIVWEMGILALGWIFAGLAFFFILVYFFKAALLEKLLELGVSFSIAPFDIGAVTIVSVSYLAFLLVITALLSAKNIGRKWENI